MANLIGLVGYAGAGKDVAAAQMHGWARISFADGVRDMCLAIDPYVSLNVDAPYGLRRLSELVESMGWDHAKRYEDVRRLLQRVGTEGGRDIFGQNCWIELAEKKIVRLSDMPVVITDVRFPNEAAMVKMYGGRLIRIVRPRNKAVNEHVSETFIATMAVDGIVLNDGPFEDLGKKVLGMAGYGLEGVPDELSVSA